MAKYDGVRQQLEQRRDKLLQEITEIQHAERDETADDQTDNAHEWENADVREDLAREAESQLKDVQAALARLEEGRYGICEGCGEPIAAKRLDALPDAVLCITCAEREG